MGRGPLQHSRLQLRSDEVHVWCVSLDVCSESHASLYSSLDEQERNRCRRFRYERDQRRFIAAHGVLRKLLGRYLNVRPEQIGYECNAFGKPGLHPKFGSRIKFNLSHSAGLTLIAVTDGAEIGVDLERVRTKFEFYDLASFFFSVEEIDYLDAQPRHLRPAAFFSCWTKKEAYLKASGEGLSRALDSFSVPLEQCVSPSLACSIAAMSDTGVARRWSMYTLAPAPGYTGALVMEGPERCLREWVWQPGGRPDVTPKRIPA